MVRTRTLLYILALSALAALACGGGDAEPTVHTNPEDTIPIMVGEQFKISLESNPSTGYRWQFVTEIDTLVIELLEWEYIPDPNPENLVGRGGHDHWRFKGAKKGATSISMRYLQPWDSTSVTRTVEFRVDVKEK